MKLQKAIETYLDTEAYGLNLILKEYFNLPKYLPLPCHVEHGWTALPHALITDLEIASEKGLMLVYSQRRKEAWIKKSKIPVYVSGSPFVLYRKKHNIKIKKNAKGTVAFPSHSTLFIEAHYDIDDYCNELKKLPKEFHPITICLLYPDIKRGRDEIYKKHSFKVVSAGEKVRGSMDFVKKYYDILSSHKYSTSNEVGTYAFYSTEIGTPFFLLGDEPVIENVGNKDRNISPKGKMSDHDLGKTCNKIFGRVPQKSVSKKQKELVEEEFALLERDSDEAIRGAIIKNMKSLKYWTVKVPMYFILSALKYLVPMKLAYFFFEKLSKNSTK